MAKQATQRVCFGGGSWELLDKDEVLSHPKGRIVLDLRVSYPPNDRVYLEEFFQEHVEKEEWPLAAAQLSSVEGCCMSALAVSILAELLEGKKPWDGFTPYDKD